MTAQLRIGGLAKAGLSLCAALSLSACASGSSMMLAGNDGGPSGFADEDFPIDQDGPADEGPNVTTPVDPPTVPSNNPILAASGNSLLPLPAGYWTRAPSAGIAGPAGGAQVALTAGLPGRAPLVGASIGAATNAVNVATNLGGAPLAGVSVTGGTGALNVNTSLAGAPLAGVSVATPSLTSPSVTASVLGTPLASVAGGQATVLGVNPVATVGSVTSTLAPTVSAVTGGVTTLLPGTAPLTSTVTGLLGGR